jgi:hypothetical protein
MAKQPQQMLEEETLVRLTKLMQMTHSDNDSEVVVAIRKANRVLIDLDMLWEDLFKLIPMIRRRVMTGREFAEEFNKVFGAAYGGQATIFPFNVVPEHMRPKDTKQRKQQVTKFWTDDANWNTPQRKPR